MDEPNEPTTEEHFILRRMRALRELGMNNDNVFEEYKPIS